MTQPTASHNQDCPGTNGQTDLSRVVSVKGSQMDLNIGPGVLPDFIVEANAAINRGFIAEAVELLNAENVEIASRKAVENPEQADRIYFMLALTFQKTRQLKKAEQWYEKILEHQEHALVLNELGCIYQHLGQTFDAMNTEREQSGSSRIIRVSAAITPRTSY